MSQLKIIAIEGGESTGKSTIAEMLSDFFDIKLIKFPNERLDSGYKIRRMLDGDDPFYPEYAQYLQNENKIETLKTLMPGTYIFDTFKLSEIVYGLANEVHEKYVRKCADLLPDPDITFLLTGKSYGYVADLFGDDDYQTTITELYLTEAKNSSGRVEIIYNKRPLDAVFVDVLWKVRGLDL